MLRPATIMNKPPEISVVLPAYNEERNVAPLAARLTEVLAPLSSYEIVFVNDHSSDATLDRIKELAQRDPRVRYVSFARNFGHMAALRAGLHHARGDAVVLMDSDFEHPPEVVLKLVDEWRRGTKVVLTKRLPDPALSPLKRASSRWFYKFLSAIGDVDIEPGSADFLLLDREAVDRINAFEDRDIFLRGLVRWFGYPTVTIPFGQGRRAAGESKYSLGKMVDLAVMGVVAHSVKPLRIAIHLSLAFAALGVLLLVYSIISFLWVHHTVAGWTSIMSAIAILGAGQFLVLGIMGEYLGKLARESRNWPVYIVAETDDAALAERTPKTAKLPKPRKPAKSGKPTTAAGA